MQHDCCAGDHLPHKSTTTSCTCAVCSSGYGALSCTGLEFTACAIRLTAVQTEHRLNQWRYCFGCRRAGILRKFFTRLLIWGAGPMAEMLWLLSSSYERCAGKLPCRWADTHDDSDQRLQRSPPCAIPYCSRRAAAGSITEDKTS